MDYYKYPIMVGWAITNKCNLRCLYCSQNSGKQLENELTLAEAFKVIDEFSENKISIIGFTGGEPFLYDGLHEVLRYANDKYIRCVVTTNGIAIANGYPIKYLSRFIKVRISLDSFKPSTHDYLRNKTGCFISVIKAIDILKRIGMQIEIVTTLSSENINEFDDMLKFIKELEIDQWSISIFCPVGRGNEISTWMINSSQYFEISKKLWEEKNKVNFLLKTDIPQLVLLDEKRKYSTQSIFCAAGTELMVLNADGSFSPCFSIPYSEGNIRTNKIYDIWNNSELFKSFRNKDVIKGKCHTCEYTQQCGGCRAMAYAKTGDYLDSDPLCWKEW